jgi:nicotinate dehydrogenase subunit A
MPLIALHINGRLHEVDAESDDSLLSVLRQDLNLTGSKYGCGEGHCGACTVLVDGQTARSCVTGIGRIAGKPVITIEGIGEPERLHPVQEAFLEVEAFQCGYCTPGMVMAAIGLLQTHERPTEDDIARVMDRNLCRCGMFSRIVRAIQLAAGRVQATSSRGEPR